MNEDQFRAEMISIMRQIRDAVCHKTITVEDMVKKEIIEEPKPKPPSKAKVNKKGSK